MKRRVRGGNRKSGTRVHVSETAPQVSDTADHGRPLDEDGYAICEGQRVLVRPVKEGLTQRTILVGGTEWTERHGWVVHGREVLSLGQVTVPAARCKIAETEDAMADFRKRSKKVDQHKAMLALIDPKLLRPTGRTREELGLDDEDSEAPPQPAKVRRRRSRRGGKKEART